MSSYCFMSSDLCVFFVSERLAVLTQILYSSQEQQSKLGGIFAVAPHESEVDSLWAFSNIFDLYSNGSYLNIVQFFETCIVYPNKLFSILPCLF